MNKFADVDFPKFARDDRQGFFNVVSSVLTGKAHTERGFPAAAVNLGWVQDTLQRLYNEGHIKTVNDVCDFLGEAVQRLKSIDCKKTKGYPDALAVLFKSKDDRGWYTYGFDLYDESGIKIEAEK